MQVTLGRRPDGKLDRRRVFGATPEEAMQKARELQVAAAQGMLSTHERLTVGEWVASWIQAKARNWAPNTRLKHEQGLKRIRPHLGSLELKRLRPHHVEALARKLQDGGLGPTTVRMALTTLSAALNHAVAMEVLPRNPCEPVRLRLPVAERRVHAWDAATVARFLEVARPYRLYPLFYLGFATGLRREELLGLAWQHVDLEARTLRVEQTLTVVGGQVHIGPPKTRSSRRVVGFGPDVAAVLGEWKAKLAEERRLLGREWHDSGLVFPSSTGHPLHPRNVNRDMAQIIKTYNRKRAKEIRKAMQGQPEEEVKRAIEAATLPHLSPHMMRHTHATLLAQKTRQIELVSRRLGHARPSITLDIYRSVAAWELEEVAVPLSELLNPAPRTLN
ncbi:tyrosine-type recombinase/integrase [Calidithermus chliarophilus]|uniref:tyrosine-type recombinase/integrase n=1 Tax=Calidithermus chliarophilus TaxID=52023 RepID=UPI00146FA8A0|nr:tyrosine-type recombinase/integrase [Calidithermus chliarophilus]